jgi:hypothetical protein
MAALDDGATELLSALDELRQLDAERRSPDTPAARRQELDQCLAARSRHVFRLAAGERRRGLPWESDMGTGRAAGDLSSGR